MLKIILVIIAIVFGGALVSALEAAFFTMSLGRAKLLKEQGAWGSTALLKIKEHLHHSITTLVILSNVIAIMGSTYVGYLVTTTYGDEALGLISAIMTFVFIIFAEIVPKMIGENHSERIARTFAPVMLFVTRIFTPIAQVIEFSTRRLMKHNRTISEEELKMLSDMGEAEGSIESDEREIIQRVFTLNDLTAGGIMTPRTVVSGLESTETLKSIEPKLYDKPYSRYPVYTDSIDKIEGICQTKDLLSALAQGRGDTKVIDYVKPVLFVPEKKRVDDLLAFFQKERAHMAVVQDEFGGTAGIVTLEDVLEQLVGEIMDETDEHIDLRAHARTANKTRGI